MYQIKSLPLHSCFSRMNKIEIFCVCALLSLTACKKEREHVRQVMQVPQTECLVKTTPVKNQGASDLCWAYAMLATIESDHLMIGDSVNLSPLYLGRRYLEEQTDRFFLSGGKEKIAMRGMASMTLHLLNRYGITHYDAFHRDEVNIRVLARKAEQTATACITQRKGLLSMRNELGNLLDEHLPTVPRYVFMLGAEYTTLEFAHSVYREGEYEALTSFTHHPFGSRFALESADNKMSDEFLNVPLDTLMQRIEHALHTGHAVCWEGDISEPKFSFPKGIAKLENDQLRVTQESRQHDFEQRLTTDDHCMEIIGMARTDKGSRYFICKNSWGTKNPFGGWMYLSENYMRAKTIAVWMKNTE